MESWWSATVSWPSPLRLPLKRCGVHPNIASDILHLRGGPKEVPSAHLLQKCMQCVSKKWQSHAGAVGYAIRKSIHVVGLAPMQGELQGSACHHCAQQIGPLEDIAICAHHEVQDGWWWMARWQHGKNRVVDSKRTRSV